MIGQSIDAPGLPAADLDGCCQQVELVADDDKPAILDGADRPVASRERVARQIFAAPVDAVIASPPGP
jgi:hypothetical protein